jgi:hypothetical protein
VRIRPLLCLWLCLALTASARCEPEDHSPRAVEIEVYCADLRPGDDSTRQAFDLWLDLLRHGKAAPFEPARLVCRKRYAVQDSRDFDARERFEPAFEAVLAGRILRDPQAHALRVFFTKAGIVYFPWLETEPNLRMIDLIHPVVQVAGGEVWVGPTRGLDLTTRIRLTAIVVRGVSAPTGWKETSSEDDLMPYSSPVTEARAGASGRSGSAGRPRENQPPRKWPSCSALTGQTSPG